MSRLNLDVNLRDHDEIYAALVSMHDGLNEAESLRVSAKLTLLLANHIGDAQIVREAIRIARSSPQK